MEAQGFVFKDHKYISIILILVLFIFILAFSGRWYVRKIYPIKYKDYIFKYSEENGIDPYLTTSVIFVESKFYPNSISKKGARGLMQIMPKTGEWIAEQIGIEDYQVDDLFDIETNIRLGTWYLAYLMKQFDGDLILVLAAYNGGQGNVREWLQQNQQVSDFDNFPYKETRDYVVKIDCVYKIYKGLYNRFTTSILYNLWKGRYNMKEFRKLDDVKQFTVDESQRLFSAEHEEILCGATTDIYFVKTIEILDYLGIAEKNVTAEVFSRANGVLAGTDEVLNLLKDKDIEIWGLSEGESFKPYDVVLRIKCPYKEFAIYETPILGILASSSGWANGFSENVERPVGDKVCLLFWQHVHPAVAPVMEELQ